MPVHLKFAKTLTVGLSALYLVASIFVVSPCASSVEIIPEPSHNHSSLNLESGQAEVIQMILDGKLKEAEEQLSEEIHDEKDKFRKRDLNYMLAAVLKMEENSSSARKHLQIVLNDEPPANDPQKQLHHALLLKRIGDCYYGERQFKDALASYNAALMISQALPNSSRILADLLESAMGILVFEKRYKEAEGYGLKLLTVTTERAKSGLWDDAGVAFWARLQMLNLYRHSNQLAEAEKMRALVSESLKSLMAYRASLESHGKLPSLAERREIFEKHYISEFGPTSPAEYVWLAGEFKLRTLPVIGWAPENGQAKSAILCVHGLGLDNQAFTAFGHEMASRGYAVYAMDVRGFGAWLTTPGQEELRLQEAINDIGSILGLVGDRHPNTPVFILGESMGGAIALRAGARYFKEINGVISSVPSAERFQSKKMGLSVAVHFLKNPNKPFNVGEMVQKKATAITENREAWNQDLKAKMEMSPKELMRFAIFMRETKRQCDQIHLPVFFVQGLKDRLVKPRGTYELFEAIAGQDKDLFIVGSEEHLIFETFNQSKMVTEAISSWMDRHSVRGIAVPAGTGTDLSTNTIENSTAPTGFPGASSATAVPQVNNFPTSLDASDLPESSPNANSTKHKHVKKTKKKKDG